MPLSAVTPRPLPVRQLPQRPVKPSPTRFGHYNNPGHQDHIKATLDKAIENLEGYVVRTSSSWDKEAKRHPDEKRSPELRFRLKTIIPDVPEVEVIASLETKTGLLLKGKPVVTFALFYPDPDGQERLYSSAMYQLTPRADEPKNPQLKPYRLWPHRWVKEMFLDHFRTSYINFHPKPREVDPEIEQKIARLFFTFAYKCQQLAPFYKALGLEAK